MKRPPRVSKNTRVSIEASGEASACTGKVPYQTGADANKAMARLRQRSGKGNVKAYRCPFCHLYHIGHANSV